MPSVHRIRRGALVAALAAALSLTACGGDDGADESAETSVPTTEASDATAAPTTDAPVDSAPVTTDAASVEDSTAPGGTAAFEIDVEVVGGEPAGGVRSYLVESGQTVQVTVVSDTADEVHLHGYDLDAELVPGTPTTLTFTADLSGSFEMEVHGSGALLFYLDVT